MLSVAPNSSSAKLTLCSRRRPELLPIRLHEPAAHQHYYAGDARTALVFSGWWRSAYNGHNLAARLLPPLHAPDVLLALTAMPHVDGCSSVESCKLHERFAALRSGAAALQIDLETQLSAQELLALLQAAPTWPVIEAAFNSSGGCTRRCTVGASPSCSYACTKLKERGNSYLAPVFGNPSLHVLHELRAQSRLYRLLLQSEAARGNRYASVVWSRLDFFWLRPHPPLRLLSSCALWVPLAEDSGGLNDRHAMMSREVADVLYFSRYDSIFDGRLLDVQPAYREGTLQGQSSERYLAMLIRHRNVTVCRFPVLAFLQCCSGQAKSTCNHKQCHFVASHLPAALAPHLLNGSDGIGGKYGGEMQAAVTAATASLIAGAKTQLVHGYDFTCEGAYTKALLKGPTLFVSVPPMVERLMCAQKCSELIQTNKSLV